MKRLVFSALPYEPMTLHETRGQCEASAQPTIQKAMCDSAFPRDEMRISETGKAVKEQSLAAMGGKKNLPSNSL
jgi:hypothetical protein